MNNTTLVRGVHFPASSEFGCQLPCGLVDLPHQPRLGSLSGKGGHTNSATEFSPVGKEAENLVIVFWYYMHVDSANRILTN